MAVIYDISTDTDREVTQQDVDALQRTQRAFGELAKRCKFHIAECRNGLVPPGQAITEIERSLQIAETMAASLNLDMDLGPVHGHHVLVVER